MKQIMLLVLICVTALAWSQEKPNIALLELDGSGITQQDLKGLTNRFQTELFKTGQFTMLERSKINDILQEQQFQMTGCTDVACAVEIGRLLNVHYVVIGSIDKVSSIFSVNVRLVDVATGQITRNEVTDCQQCTLDEVFLTVLKNVARRIAGLEIDESPQKIVDIPRAVDEDSPPVQPAAKPKHASRFAMGFFTGFNTAHSLEEENTVYIRKHISTNNFGITYDVPITSRLYLQPELIYANRKSELTGIFYTTENRTEMLHYLEIPLLLSYHWTKGYSVFIGPSWSFLTRGIWESDTDSGDYEDSDEFNGTLTRFIMGVQIRLGPLSLGYRMTSDLDEENEISKTRRTLSYLTLGLMFRR